MLLMTSPFPEESLEDHLCSHGQAGPPPLSRLLHAEVCLSHGVLLFLSLPSWLVCTLPLFCPMLPVHVSLSSLSAFLLTSVFLSAVSSNFPVLSKKPFFQRGQVKLVIL